MARSRSLVAYWIWILLVVTSEFGEYPNLLIAVLENPCSEEEVGDRTDHRPLPAVENYLTELLLQENVPKSFTAIRF